MVIDTDGSAFITKAEFDSLKNNFQAQIDNYNTSIDSKIDGAIAAYLAGVKVTNTMFVDVVYNKYKIDGYGTSYNLVWSGAGDISDITDATELDRLGLYHKFGLVKHMTAILSAPNANTTTDSEWVGGVLCSACVFDGTWSGQEDTTLNIYKLSSTGSVDQALATVPTFTAVFGQAMAKAQKAEGITSLDSATLTAIGGDTRYVKYTTTALSSSIYTNEKSCETLRIWPNGYNGFGEAGPWDSSKNTYSSSSRHFGFNYNSAQLSWADQNATKLPILYACANSTVQVNASKTDAKALTAGTSGAQSGGVGDIETFMSTLKSGFNYNLYLGNAISRQIYYYPGMANINWNYSVKSFTITTATASELIYDNFVTLDSRNGKIKNGLVFCDINEDGNITVEMTPSEKGYIYLWQSPTSSDTWNGKKPTGAYPTETQLGYDPEVTDPGTVWRRTFQVNKTKGPLWILYRPYNNSSGKREGKLDSCSAILESEE